jgi:hypothetical protein
MTRDFTLRMYRDLMETVTTSVYTPTLVCDYLTSPPARAIILRHDVDRAPERALNMAKVEGEMGVQGSYYFRRGRDVFNPKIISEIADMGHEIGYHYETLDKAKGDVNKAIHIFEHELAEFREIVDIKTVCMHGNPLAPWANRDMWGNHDLKDFGLLGEPYLSIDYNTIMYLTDTGRTWAGGKVSVKDVVNTQYANKVSSTTGVIDLIRSGRFPGICLLAHPNRWCDDFSAWLWELVWQNAKNVGKRGIVWYRKSKNGG